MLISRVVQIISQLILSLIDYTVDYWDVPTLFFAIPDDSWDVIMPLVD